MGEVGSAEFLLGDVVGEHVPDRGGDPVFDGDQGPEWAATGGQPFVADLQVGVLGPLRAEGGESEGTFEIRVAGADLGVLGAAGGLVVAGADIGPGREVPGGGNRVMSPPVSAMITSATARLIPGTVSSRSSAGRKGAIASSIRSSSCPIAVVSWS